MLLLNSLIIFLLITIFWEDLKLRSVHWFLFPALAICLFCYEYKNSGLTATTLNTVSNLAFIALQTSILTIYISIKQRKLTNIFKNMIGLGDLLFFVALAFYFSLVNYIIFYILSLLSILLFWPVSNLIGKKKDKYIPLAGIQAFLFACIFLTAVIWPSSQIKTNEWLLSKLMV